MQFSENNSQSFLLNILLLAIFLALELPANAQDTHDSSDGSDVLFYPSLPEPPRIQYLTRFSISKDIKEKKESKGWLARFVLGEETPEDMQGPEKPYGVALHAGRIHVVDTRGGGYAIFDIPGRDYRFVYGSGAAAMIKPINMDIGADGIKYITDTIKERVLAFDGDDKYFRAYGLSENFQPTDVRVVGDQLYVADLAGHRIVIFDKQTGEQLGSFGAAGEPGSVLFQPTNIAVSADNHLYVSDTGNFRVLKYTLDGEYVRSYGAGVGNAPGNFARPKGIDVDREGRLYVVDAAFENVQIFDNEGRLLLFFGEKAANHEGGLDLPTDIDIDYDSVSHFQQYAHPSFDLEYVILVGNQFGRSKVSVFGFGKFRGMNYPEDE